MSTQECEPYLRDDCTTTTTGTCCDYNPPTSTIPKLPDSGADSAGLALLGAFSLLAGVILILIVLAWKRLSSRPWER